MNLNECLQQGRTGPGLSGGTSPPVLQSSELSVSTDGGHRGSWIVHIYGASDDLAVSMWILVTRGHSDTFSAVLGVQSCTVTGTPLDLLHMCCALAVTQACKCTPC